VKAAERVIGWKRKWCTVNREFCEDGEVVRWRAMLSVLAAEANVQASP